MHPARGFLEAGEQAGGQGTELGALGALEVAVHLLAGGAVDPGVRDTRLPLGQPAVLLAQAGKLASGQRVGLHVLDPGLDLALVARHRRFGGQDHHAIVGTELAHLGIEFGLEPVRLGDGRPQVVDDQGGRDSAPVSEGVLHAPDEVLGGLLPEGLRVPLARSAQDQPQYVGTPPSAGFHHPGTLPEIHLGFLARRTFHPPERQGLGLPQRAHKPLHRVIAARERLGLPQILIDPLRGQTALHRGLDLGPIRFTLTDPSGPEAGGRNGWFWRRGSPRHRRRFRRRAGGQNGRV